MALLYMDGFDHCGTSGSNNTTALATKYSSSNFIFLNSAVVRTGVNSVRWVGAGGDSNNYLITKTLPASGAAIVGHARHGTGGTTWGGAMVRLREGTTVHLELNIDSTGHLLLKRGTTTIATGTTVLALGSWYYLELKAVIHDTAGSYEVRIDGLTEAALTASGVDTRNGGTTGQWDNVYLGGGTNGENHADDLYVCDSSGALNTDFLGNCKVETLFPQTGNGTNTGLTPSTGTDHGALVDENPPNTTDYNSSATVSAKDTYNYPSLSLTGAVLGVQTNLYLAKSDAAARMVCAVVRASGADYDGANVSPTTTFGYFSEVRQLNPATGLAWTSADIAALEAGMKVTA